MSKIEDNGIPALDSTLHGEPALREMTGGGVESQREPALNETKPRSHGNAPPRKPIPIRSFRSAIPLALGLAGLPFVARADTAENTESMGRPHQSGPLEPEQNTAEQQELSEELEAIFQELSRDPTIQEGINALKGFLQGDSTPDQQALVRAIGTLDKSLENHALKNRFDELVREQVRKNDFSSLDKFLKELGLTLSSQNMWYLYFYITSLAMGFGVAFDVMAANLGRFRKSESLTGNFGWASELGASHIILPVASGAMTALAINSSSVFGSQIADGVERGVAGLSAYLIARILREEIFEGEDEEGEKAGAMGSTRKTVRALVAVNLANMWAVSADSASSGGAKYLEALLKRWTQGEILESIIIGGSVVFICSLASGMGALQVKRAYKEAIAKGSDFSTEAIERLQKICLAGETGILGYFALNAAVNGMARADLGRGWVAVLSALGTAAVLGGKDLYDGRQAETKKDSEKIL
ncbi:hypothetical protein HYV56_00435 [Candidatus Peregrinibacteria bacterium]|nr:hypothetical protein [Candidatus Peregrinibacteria bacterium]